MARHKVYVTVTPCKHDGRTGTTTTSGARFSIDKYEIDINADLLEGSDIDGKIVISSVDGKVTVKVNCPKYNLDVQAANNLLVKGTCRTILRGGLS